MSDKNPTENHELPRPEPGSFEGSWGDEIMNDDLTAKLEERTPIVDVESELSTYEPYETAAFIASDTGRRFVGDGDAWLKVGDEDNPIQGTIHLEAVSAEDSKTDRAVIRFDPDVDDLQTVINEAPENALIKGHKETEITVGTIDINTRGVRVESIKARLADGTDDHMIHVTADDVTLSDLILDGNLNNQIGTSDCVLLDGVDNATIRDSFIKDALNHGIASNHEGQLTERNANITVENCRLLDYGDDGVTSHWTDGMDMRSVYCSGGRGDPEQSGGTSAGFEIEWGCTNVTLESCFAWDNPNGYWVKTGGGDAPINITFNNSHAWNNGNNFHIRAIADDLIDNEPEGVYLNNCISVDPDPDGAKRALWVRGYDVVVNGGRYTTHDNMGWAVKASEATNLETRLVLTGGVDVETAIAFDDPGELIIDHARSNSGVSTAVNLEQSGLSFEARNLSIDGGEVVRADGVTITEAILNDSEARFGIGNGGSHVRQIVNDRGFNDGDPNTDGDWNNQEALADERNIIVEDETNDNLYMAVGGSFSQIG